MGSPISLVDRVLNDLTIDAILFFGLLCDLSVGVDALIDPFSNRMIM